MSTQFSLGRILRNPIVAVAGYVGPVLALTFATWVALADIYQRQAGLAGTRAMLDQLEGRRSSPGGTRALAGSVPPGSPFVEGETVTVAGAAILQRVAGAIQRYGGNVLSSQVGLEGPQSKSGMVSVTLSAEVGEPDLQKVLYDLETGMPFLFVEQLVVQSSRGVADSDGGRLRVLLGVSGQWQGAK
jgi:general secretion pathway protein M